MHFHLTRPLSGSPWKIGYDRLSQRLYCTWYACITYTFITRYHQTKRKTHVAYTRHPVANGRVLTGNLSDLSVQGLSSTPPRIVLATVTRRCETQTGRRERAVTIRRRPLALTDGGCRRRISRTVQRAARRATASNRRPRRRRRRRASRRPAASPCRTTTRPFSTAAARCWAARRRGRCRRRLCPSTRRVSTPGRTAAAEAPAPVSSAAARPSGSAGIARPAAVTGSPAWTSLPSGTGYWTGRRQTASLSR